MGIRIHKCIGYGLNDFKGKSDPRINPLGYLGEDIGWEDKDETWTKEGFYTYYKNHIEFAIYWDYVQKYFEVYDSVIFDDEYGMKNVLLISPSFFKSWQRYDDIIDYVEAEKGSVNSCKVLTYGIWPYNGIYTDLRTYEELKDNKDLKEFKHTLAREFLYSYNSSKCTSRKQKKMFLEYAHLYATKLGFNDIETALKNIVPSVPEEIELLCKWLMLFNDDNTIKELKPMIYTYWG